MASVVVVRGLQAGFFPVAKDDVEDRTITDRRPWNVLEESLGRVDLPQGTRLARLVIRPWEVVVLHARDIRHHYHRLAVPAAKVERQAVGPRVPRVWFEHADEVCFDHVEHAPHWLWEDFMLGLPEPPYAKESRWVQLCFLSALMGDLKALLGPGCLG